MDGVCSAESRAKFEDQNLEGNSDLLIEVKNDFRKLPVISFPLKSEVINYAILSEVFEKGLDLSHEKLSIFEQIPKKTFSKEYFSYECLKDEFYSEE